VVKLKRCTGCMSGGAPPEQWALYCSKECQQGHWRQHKLVCWSTERGRQAASAAAAAAASQLPPPPPPPPPMCVFCGRQQANTGLRHGSTTHQTVACGQCAGRLVQGGGRDRCCPWCRCDEPLSQVTCVEF